MADKKQEDLFFIEPVKLKVILDKIEEMFDLSIFEVLVYSSGFRFACNKEDFSEKFKEIDSRDLYDFNSFIMRLVRDNCSNIDEFIKNYPDNLREKVKESAKILLDHNKFGALVFRHLNRTNKVMESIQSRKNIAQIRILDKIINPEYYDIDIPLYNSLEEKEQIIRIEMDKYELKQFIENLTEILDDNHGSNNKK